VRIGADAASPAAPPGGAAATPDPRLADAAKAFEQQLLSILTRELQRTATLLGSDGDSSGDTSQPGGLDGGMLSDTLAQALSDAGGVGLAAELTRPLGGAA
jgi:Rod binding domain-containing protein